MYVYMRAYICLRKCVKYSALLKDDICTERGIYLGTYTVMCMFAQAARTNIRTCVEQHNVHENEHACIYINK